jgi:hypothetical protein
MTRHLKFHSKRDIGKQYFVVDTLRVSTTTVHRLYPMRQCGISTERRKCRYHDY